MPYAKDRNARRGCGAPFGCYNFWVPLSILLALIYGSVTIAAQSASPPWQGLAATLHAADARSFAVEQLKAIPHLRNDLRVGLQHEPDRLLAVAAALATGETGLDEELVAAARADLSGKSAVQILRAPGGERVAEKLRKELRAYLGQSLPAAQAVALIENDTEFARHVDAYEAQLENPSHEVRIAVAGRIAELAGKKYFRVRWERLLTLEPYQVRWAAIAQLPKEARTGALRATLAAHCRKESVAEVRELCGKN